MDNFEDKLFKNCVTIAMIIFAIIMLVGVIAIETERADAAPADVVTEPTKSVSVPAETERRDKVTEVADDYTISPELFVYNTEVECTISETESQTNETVCPSEQTTDTPKEQGLDKDSEYYYASEIWTRLKREGYSDVVCSGILGNVMAECGGNTLCLHPFLGSDFYGICQWSKLYFPEIHGSGFEAQIDFLINTIRRQMGNKYDDLIESDNLEDASLTFAKYYERCASCTYSVRVENAAVAYDFFVK